MNPTAVADHFTSRDPIVRQIYDRLLAELRSLGPVTEDPKRTSIHLVNSTALAGIATRKRHLVLTLKSDRPLDSSRIHRSERTSAKRYHHELKLSSPADVDAELIGWLREAFDLSA